MSNLAVSMAKDPKKKRIEVHVMPELKEALVKMAKADNRSLLNYIETLLEKHVAKNKTRN
jgi:predicted HicB family RNase H-like nuclease